MTSRPGLEHYASSIQSPDTGIKIETCYGLLAVPNAEDIISRFLGQCGEWARDEASFVASVLPDNPRILDAGAFLGTFGLGVALRKCIGFLCFVEANPAIVKLLRENVERCASFPNVVVNAMLAGLPTEPRRGFGDPRNLGATSFLESAADDNPTEPPEYATTLNDLVAEHGAFDLVKLDVEGMERDILEPARNCLVKGDTTLWIECNEHPRSLELVKMLLSWGLDIHYFAFPSHNPDNFRGAKEAIFPWAYEAGLLVSPGKPPRLDAELMAHGCILRRIGTIEDLVGAMWRTPRWLPAELAHAGAPELAAIAGHALRGQDRDGYLAASSDPGKSLLMRMEDRLTAAETGLSEARALLLERQAEMEREHRIRDDAEQRLAEARALLVERQTELEREHRIRDDAEQRLAQAAAVALARLGEIGSERDRAEAAMARVEAAEQHALAQIRDACARVETALAQMRAARQQSKDARACLLAMQATVAWRVTSPVNSFIDSRPRLHATLRRVRAAAGSLLGRRG